ncbi:MAG TPA: acyltransferase [Bryobacteraceae bacterium]|nr:acyltransferase [Bryobacteraceae bacterium]
MLRRVFAMCTFGVLAVSERPGRVLPMEGVRGVGMLLVFLAHCTVIFRDWIAPESLMDTLAGRVFVIGQTGVDMFFVLSGYLIYSLALGHRGSWRRFLARRAQRIYPPFLAVLGLYIVLALALPGEGRLPETGRWLYLAQCVMLLPGFFDIRPLFAVAWSLSYEAAYYLSAPLLVAVAGLQRRGVRTRVLIILAGGLAYTAAVWFRFPEQWPAVAFSPWHHWRLLLFPAGMLAYEAVKSAGRLDWRWHWVAVSALFVAFGPFLLWVANPLFQQPWPGLLRAGVLGVATGVAFVAAFSGPGVLAAVFSWAPLRWLGNLSYSFYLVHGLGLHLVAMAARPWAEAPFWGLCAAGFLAASAVSLALFFAVERRYSLRAPRFQGRA